MVKHFFLSLLFLTVCNVSVYAQAYAGGPECMEPLPHKIDEFDYVDANDLKLKFTKFVNLLNKLGNKAEAVVHVYGGRRSRSDEIQSVTETIRKVANVAADRLWIRDMGYRNQASFEFFLRPLECTLIPSGISDLNVDEVELTDLPATRLGTTDISSNILKEPEAKCSPAARAVRACDEGSVVEVFVVVSKEGKVVVARAMNGHPLNRINAAQIATQIQFRPFEIGGVVSQVSGTIKIVYIRPEEIVTN